MYRIYLKDLEGTCSRTRLLKLEEVKEELPKFVERSKDYIINDKPENYKYEIVKEVN